MNFDRFRTRYSSYSKISSTFARWDGSVNAVRRSLDTISILRPGISTVYDKLERVDGFKTITSVLPSRRHLLPGVIRLVINYKGEIKLRLRLEQVVLD